LRPLQISAVKEVGLLITRHHDSYPVLIGWFGIWP
jgi:hypothetical protein